MKPSLSGYVPTAEYENGTPLPSSGRHSPEPDRRTTILNLVEMLLKDNESTEYRNLQIPSFEDDRDVPTVDEHLQAVGAEGFNILQRRINSLDKELRNFANAARQLGSSVAILSSAFHLRERLAQLLFLYHENAADLFPRKVQHIVRETVPDSPTSNKRKRGFRRVKGKAQLHVPRPQVAENIDPESFPEQLEFLAKEVTTFLRCLNEFPEFTDEAVNASILSFEGDLKYWSSCLKEYAGQFRYPSVQRYIHELSSEMGHHLDDLTSSLSMFIEVGVPTIRFAQKHGADNLLNLSTVATFFSAVTATTLQFSYQLERAKISDSVNCFWFASMVFSIAAAVNSLLGLTWKQAMYRSPGHRVPWWVLIWIKRSPLVFLVLSVACFSIGLCCFAYASHQAHVTSTVTTVLTAFTSFGLAAVSAWFASERWAFSRHKGQKWLSDILFDANERFLVLPGVTWMIRGLQVLRRHFRKLHKAILRLCSRFSGLKCQLNSMEFEDDLEASRLPTSVPGSPYVEEPKECMTPKKRRASDATSTAITSELSLGFPTTSFSAPTPVNSPVDAETPIPASPAVSASTPSVGKQLWKNAVRNVKMRNAISTPNSTSGGSVATVINRPRAEPVRQRTLSSSMGITDRKNGEAMVPFTRSRVSALVPKLVELEATHDLAAHTALVRHMQFSPDGKFLATSSWDKTAVIFKVGHPFIPHRTLAHAQGFVGQVAWSPNGKILLTKMARGVKVWTAEEGVCRKTINRNTSIEAITWCPTGDAFLSIEDSIVTKLDLTGKVLDQYDFGNMKLHDVAITPDSQRLLGVGPLLRSPNNLQPSKSRVEKRLVVLNMDSKQIENLTPVLEDVRDITIAQTSRSGLVALISYEHKAPPQLWKLELIKDKETNAVISSRLSLRHTYMPKILADFAGPSYFGGQNNELVLCAGKAGDIHIWDQESGALLHFIRAQAHGGDMTCIAWNHAAKEPFMFATGSHDGAVRVWTRHPSNNASDASEMVPRNITEFPQRSHSPYQMGSNMSGSSLSLEDYQSGHTRFTSSDNRSMTWGSQPLLPMYERELT
ncbi:WD40 repeat-like protein [Pholiota conissans]|uniref:WD40 repeat-like protein n=1 Tax=Pholiota conissans TaxID=109636 RepID=A0A9P5ZA88_9AGAR|nr:WD40 repeat-like protein [Pholiota conissans]